MDILQVFTVFLSGAPRNDCLTIQCFKLVQMSWGAVTYNGSSL
jgi:hypothetical protein